MNRDTYEARDVPSPGSKALPDAPADHRPSGYDPSRIEVEGVRYVREDAFLFLQEWLWTELKISRDQSSQAALGAKWALERAIKLHLNSHLPTLDEVRAAWRDSDTHPEGGDACGSVHE